MSTITITGNLTAQPELKFVPNGAAVCTFNVAVSQRVKQAGDWVDGEPMFIRVTAWRDLAEHIAESLDKGQRVIVSGKLKSRTWEQDGNKRTSFEIDAEEVGPSLRFATAKPQRAVNTAKSNGAASKPTPAMDDPWGAGETAPF